MFIPDQFDFENHAEIIYSPTAYLHPEIMVGVAAIRKDLERTFHKPKPGF